MLSRLLSLTAAFILLGCTPEDRTVRIVSTTPVQPQSLVPASEYCPPVGTLRRGVRLDRGSVSQFSYLAPRNGFPCYIRTNLGEVPINFAGRSIVSSHLTQHATAMGAMVPFQSGKAAEFRSFVPVATGAGATALILIRYEVAGLETLTLEGMRYETAIVDYSEVNGGCTATWRAWVDRTSLTPVQVDTNSVGCYPPLGFRWRRIM
jgi:hypothetical protein